MVVIKIVKKKLQKKMKLEKKGIQILVSEHDINLSAPEIIKVKVCENFKMAFKILGVSF